MVKQLINDFNLIINEPTDKLVIQKPVVKVSGLLESSGKVDFSKAEVTVSGDVSGGNVAVSKTGEFKTEIYFPDEEGEYVIEIEAVLFDKTKSEIEHFKGLLE